MTETWHEAGISREPDGRGAMVIPVLESRPVSMSVCLYVCVCVCFIYVHPTLKKTPCIHIKMNKDFETDTKH